MTRLRADLPPLPERMRSRPIDPRGYPVPWFVGTVNGEYDFRTIRAGGIVEAYNKGRCWLCGDKLGRFKVFVIGPMCAVTRTTSEPPSHRECAEFAAKACPFLTHPMAKYNDHNLPVAQPPVGNFIERNPGVICLWTAPGCEPFAVDGGVLFTVDEPVLVEWWARGRPATRAEVEASITSGLPFLTEVATKEGPDSILDLTKKLHAVERFLPKEKT